jgi:glutamate dehydrogenase/leucine dehydrogenase
MVLKYGFNYMAQGGAKAGIAAPMDLPTDQKRRLLRRFGEIIAPMLLGGYYHTGPDMSVNAEDIEDMLAHIGAPVATPRKGKGKKSGLYTAMAVMVAAEAAAAGMETSLEGKTVAVEGFGAVGSAYAMLMTKKKKARVVAISTTKGAIFNPKGLDVDELLRLLARHGNALVNHYKDADCITNEELLLLDVDVLSPCARQFAITEENADKVKAPLICPGANNPTTLEAEDILFRRKIISVPDFVANCGGVLGNKIETLGVGEDFIESFIRNRNFNRVLSMLERSRKAGKPMLPIAIREAMDNFTRMQQAALQPGVGSIVQKVGLGAFKAGLIPGFVSKPLAPWYLSRAMRLPAQVN